ncbi:carbohydrate ABC transporter permease [Nonomuraea ferruginea]
MEGVRLLDAHPAGRSQVDPGQLPGGRHGRRGLGAWQKFRRITLPLLKPTLFFVLVIETISAFQVFDTIYVMTGGGPARATYTLIYGIYDHGFRSFDFGYAATWGVVLFAIVLAVSLIQRRFLDRGNT